MSKDITVSACIDCPARKYRGPDNFGNGGGYCSLDAEQRLVKGSPYGDRQRQPAPPDWCPAREGVTIRFVKPSSLGKIVSAYIPPEAFSEREQPDSGADEELDVFGGAWWSPQEGDIPF